MDGEKIKVLRKQNKLTQPELAKLMGVSKNTILNWEKGGVIPDSKQDLLYNVLEKSQYLSDEQIDILEETQEKYQNWDVEEIARFFQMNQTKLLKNEIIKQIIEKEAYKIAFDLLAQKLAKA